MPSADFARGARATHRALRRCRKYLLALKRHLADNHGQMALSVSIPIQAVRRGLPAGRLDQMAQLLGVDRAFLLRIVGVSERTLQRKQEHAAKLSPAASDRLSRIDRIYSLAAEVFGNGEKAAQWLKRPSRALAKEWPLRLLDTDAGAQQVEQELRQIQHGFVY